MMRCGSTVKPDDGRARGSGGVSGEHVSCVILLLLMTFILINITSRPDWREQIVALLCIMIFLVAGIVHIGLTAYDRTVKWNDEYIVIE